MSNKINLVSTVITTKKKSSRGKTNISGSVSQVPKQENGNLSSSYFASKFSIIAYGSHCRLRDFTLL